MLRVSHKSCHELRLVIHLARLLPCLREACFVIGISIPDVTVKKIWKGLILICKSIHSGDAQTWVLGSGGAELTWQEGAIIWLDPRLRFSPLFTRTVSARLAEVRSLGFGRQSWVTRCLHSHSVSFLYVGRGGDIPLCKKELSTFIHQIRLHDFVYGWFINYQTRPFFCERLAHFATWSSELHSTALLQLKEFTHNKSCSVLSNS